ncbi:MAG TPA: nicotinate (nicotinamide) nucleotide adenylyltransferase [Flavobacteriales bacterium]|nr:nicotinate (nicotinamide) nucleotide adenylyltransferase [Flavobacteriales bacterium]HMR26673.1 nicotinate (nicotinamide) nucleotide adenylyltransferase [Flavobacteriales bacterium]
MTIACLFGTFDPPHRGHVHIARRVLEVPGIDRVWLVVTPRNPFKMDRAVSPDQDRMAMVRLAVQGLHGVEASEAELGLPPPNYTADTLALFRSRWPEHRFALVIGSDNLAQLHRWKDPEAILANHRVLVYPRPGVDLHQGRSGLAGHAGITLLEGPVMDISSTRIRTAIREGRDPGPDLDPAVYAHIAERKLYRD